VTIAYLVRFLLAELHLESLKTKTDIRSLRKALDILPEELDKTYEEAIERIQSQPEDESKLAMRVLSWITHAIRPLKVEEILYAIAVMNLDPGDTTLDEEGLTDEAELITVCGGIVIVDQDSRVIRLVHYTTQEYFNRKRGKWFPNAESQITTTCITYLSFNVFESEFCQTVEEFKERLQSNKFFEYSARNWGHHARIAPTSNLALSQAVMEFLRSEAKVDASSQGLLAFKDPWGYTLRVPKLKGVHLAAYFGIEMVMKLLLESSTVNADLKDTYGRKPISWAAENGHEAIVRLLLENGADPNPKDDDCGWTPLSQAAQNGHETVVKLLLEKGAELEWKDDEYGQTPLSWAARNGHEAIVRLLLENGADPNPKDDDYGRMSLIARKGYGTGVLISTNIEYGRTPLSWAAENGYEAIVKLLLENGAEVEAEDINGRTPLSYAIGEA
jgi:hypothetical protein